MTQPTSQVPLHVAVDGRYLAIPGVGIHGYTVGLIKIFVELGAKVTVLSNVAPQCQLDPRVHTKIFGSETNIVWDQVSLPRHFADHTYDVYWAPANNGIPLLGARPPRTVFTLHDLIPLLQFRDHIASRPLYGIPWLLAAASGLLRADVVTTVSEFSADRIHSCSRRRAQVIPPSSVRKPIATGSPAPQHPALRGRYALYNGGFGSRKRVDTILRAMALLPKDFELQLVCLGRHMDDYSTLVDELGVHHRVVAPGYVTDADRDSWVEHAFALLYPSTMEGFGMPLLESMARGVPVVTSPNSSLQEVGGDAALFADPADPRAWADVLVALDDPARRTAHAEKGLRRAEYYRNIDLDGLVAQVIGMPTCPAPREGDR